MTLLRLAEGAVAWRDVDGDVVALELATSSYLGANSAGSVLWKLLAEGATREQLASRLVEEFDIETVRAAEDVETFLRQLRARDLLA